jgi:hypothetical protein
MWLYDVDKIIALKVWIVNKLHVHHMNEVDEIMVLEMYMCYIYDSMTLCIVVFVHHIIYVACALCERKMMASS